MMGNTNSIIKWHEIVVAERPIGLALSISNGDDIHCESELDKKTGKYIGKILDHTSDGLLRELVSTNPIFETGSVAIETMQKIVVKSKSMAVSLVDLCASIVECSL